MKPAKLAVAMAKAESLVPTIDKKKLTLQNLKHADDSACNYDPFNITIQKKEKKVEGKTDEL